MRRRLAPRTLPLLRALSPRSTAGLLAVFLLGLAFLLAPLAAPATELRAIRHWSAPDHTRLVIDLDEPAAYRHRFVEDPPRIAVDVADGVFVFDRDPILIGDGLVERVRFNVLSQSGKAQVVLDLVVRARYDVFALPELETKPNRIVIDVKRPASLQTPRPVRRREERTIGPESFGDFIVVIDPGHGGEDPGRVNPGGLKEKDLALLLARDLQQQVNKRRGYRAKLTRKGDYFVSLRRRREVAEELGAHIFVSLHFNAAPSGRARGSEIFFVSLQGAVGRAEQELVRVENSADLVGGLPPRDEGTSDELARMLVDLRQNDSVERSQRLATILTDRIGRIRGVSARKVKQAGFAVLKSLFMPAVLVEAGFLTNRADLRFIQSRQNRARYADALADGIVAYCEEVEIPRLGWQIHVVGRGESLSTIAHQYAMDLSALRDANSIQGDLIRIGQKLRVRPR
jgi:N-acetylmuramoyl-L-alanine amidase